MLKLLVSVVIFTTNAYDLRLKCIETIIDVENAKNILIIRDGNSTTLINHFDVKTQSIYTLGSEIQDDVNIRNYDFYLIQTRFVNLHLVKTTLEKIFIIPQFKFECFVLVQLIEAGDLDEVFRIFWYFYILKILVIDHNLNVYTYFPITRGKCGETQATYLSKCMEFTNNTLAYDNVKNVDYAGCSIRAYLRQMPPFVQQGDFNTNPGFLIQIFRQIFQYLKLKPITIPHNVTSGVIALPNGSMVNLLTKLPNGSYMGLAKNTIERKSDILLITLGLSPAVDDFDYTYPLDFTKIRFYVPVASPIEPWKNIFKVFTLNVWIAILTSLITFTPIWHLFYRNETYTTLPYSFLILIKTMLTSHDIKLKFDSAKILYITWIIFAFMIISSYQSLLLSFIFQPSYQTQITTIEQLSISKIAIKSVKVLTQKLLEFESKQLARISKRIESVESLVPGPWREILEKGAIAIFSADNAASVAASAYKHHKAFAMDWGFTDQSIILMAKGSPFTARINVVIKRLHESGIMARWMPPSVRKQVVNEDGFKAINLMHFISTLGIYVCGITLSVIVFCVELVYSNFQVVIPNIDTNNV